jgi:hypothetical protein
MKREEFRVTWNREGVPPKRKRYQRRAAAERFVLLIGPEPWLALGKDPESLWCCSGYDDGCGGLTWREKLLADRKERTLPPLESVHVECRVVEVGPWEPLARDGEGGS